MSDNTDSMVSVSLDEDDVVIPDGVEHDGVGKAYASLIELRVTFGKCKKLNPMKVKENLLFVNKLIN